MVTEGGGGGGGWEGTSSWWVIFWTKLGLALRGVAPHCPVRPTECSQRVASSNRRRKSGRWERSGAEAGEMWTGADIASGGGCSLGCLVNTRRSLHEG